MQRKFAQNCGDVFVHNDERENPVELVKIGNSGNSGNLNKLEIFYEQIVKKL